MPSTSKAQQRLFQMALAVRRGDLKRSDVHDEVLKIVDGDMSDKQIEDFTKLKESKTNGLKKLSDFLSESLFEEFDDEFQKSVSDEFIRLGLEHHNNNNECQQ